MKMKVLVVEDEAMIRELLTMLFEQQGHEVHEAENADQAIAFLKTNDFDFVMTDNDMPDQGRVRPDQGMRVIEFACAVPNRPFILWASGRASSEPVLYEKALAKGADQVIFKPFNIDEFKSIVYRAAARKMMDVIPV